MANIIILIIISIILTYTLYMWYTYTFNAWVWLSTILESKNIKGELVKYPGTKKQRHHMHMT